MSDEVALFEETINEQKAEFEKALETLDAMPGNKEREEHITRMEAQVKKMRKTLTSYRYQVRSIKDPLTKGSYDKKFREHEQDVNNYEKELRNARQNGPAPGAGGGGGEGGESPKPELQTTDQVLCQALNIQDQSLAALQRAQQHGAAAEVTGNEINVELRKQTERAAEVAEYIDTIEAQLKRAQKDMVWFVRNAMTDKCFVLLMVLVIAAIVFIIVWKIWGKNFNTETIMSLVPELPWNKAKTTTPTLTPVRTLTATLTHTRNTTFHTVTPTPEPVVPTASGSS